MADAQHKDAPLGHRHATHNWSVASQSAREALAVTANDVGKDCLQTDTSPPTVWKLVRVTGGIAWMNLGAQGMTPEQTQQLTDALAKANALGTQTYLVQSLTSDLTAERALEGADGLTVDFGTAGKAIVKPTSTLASPSAIAANTSAIQALRTPSYVVQTLSGELDSERTLEGADGVVVDFATPGKAIVRGPSIPAAGAPVGAQYITAAADPSLSAERVLEGADGLLVDFATAAKAIIRAGTLGGLRLWKWSVAARNDVVTSIGDSGKVAYVHSEGVAELHVLLDEPTQTWLRLATSVDVDLLLSSLANYTTLLAGKADKFFLWGSPKTANYTLAVGDASDPVRINSASNLIVTVPPGSAVAMPTGCVVPVYRWGTGTVTIAAGAGVTIRCARTAPWTIAAQYGEPALLQKVAADEWLLTGGLT